MPSERRQIAAGRSFGAFRQISRGIVVEKNGAGQVGTRQADEGIFILIVDKFKPVQRCLALAQRERFSKVLKHQVNRFRTICTVCGFVALS
ncbi:TPA: hypothetical protein ACFOL8_001546 [Neisseria meningitidis]|uniref:hypothetical protein n=12 Tax=Neisseria meningitidis TaxID=487 RepID=UPI00039A6889|nr:hypothetical protein [Neisseria meningitidis]MBG9145530.1 hypothetical protein [Neisseria meningitidis]MBG9156322.1 hypothetical protein [Neisseria meningitidis]MBG9158540.1 hypothetical protein [Neisseria meningitidis]MBG9195146.1 hypothetical protein [Neisseria meningitidis]MBG9203869.1 hypothetical protein [Neisseria meningitidis]